MVREIVVISGKGGTGKTSVTASLAVLAGDSVIADCDVDASDLHLVLTPKVRERHEFTSGHHALITDDACSRCGICVTRCRFGAIRKEINIPNQTFSLAGIDGDSLFVIDPTACEGCGVCAHFCPEHAIDLVDNLSGEWMISDTRSGPMAHARLGIAAENSGKLVSEVRKQARRIAEEQGKELIIVDGPPGIGCPVIASVTGASEVLVVAEPTVSGDHDLERVLSLSKHFKVPATVCINKWDLNPDAARRIESRAIESGARIAGRIRYDPSVTAAQLKQLAVVETDSQVGRDVRRLWEFLSVPLEARRGP